MEIKNMQILLKNLTNPNINDLIWYEKGEWVGNYYRMYRYEKIFMQVPSGIVLKIIHEPMGANKNNLVVYEAKNQ
jgi:hypothetical protein